MAQTTNRNIYYPDDYTEDADIPADMKEMAESIDAAIEEAVQETTYDDTELRGRIFNAENDIDTLEGQVGILQGSMSAAETDIDDLETDLATAEEKISKLQNDVEDLRNNSLQVSGTGTNFKLSNTAKARFIELLMKGNTFQQSYTGKNLFNPALLSQEEGYNTYDDSTGLWTTSELGSYYRSIFYNVSGNNNTRNITKLIKLKANTTYTIKFYDLIRNDITINLGFFDSEGSAISHVGFTADNKTFTTESECYLDIRRQGNSETLSFSKIQLEEGSTATSYEPYVGGTASPNPDYPQTIHNVTGNINTHIENEDGTEEQNISIALGNIELNKIPDTDIQDSVYKRNGKWYLHKEAMKRVFDGTESGWSYNATSSGNFRFYMNTDIGIKDPENSETTLVAKIVSDKFKAVSMGNTWSGKTGISILHSGTQYTYARLCMCYVSNETNGTTKFKAWLDEERPIVLYPMREPTDTEITDTTLINQLEAYLQAYSYINETNISATSSDLEPIITATAIRSLNDILTRLEVLESEV